MIRSGLISLIVFVILLGCSSKVETKVNYPFLNLKSFETLEEIDNKVVKLTGKHCSVVDDWQTKSCSFDFINTDSISSHCYMQFNKRDELIWFQSWYRSENNDLEYLYEWYTNNYNQDTLLKRSDNEIEIKDNDQTYHYTIPSKGSKVLYFGQFFTEEVPIGDQ